MLYYRCIEKILGKEAWEKWSGNLIEVLKKQYISS